MKIIQKVFDIGAKAFRQEFGSTMKLPQLKALSAMKRCRTETMGKTTLACKECGVIKSYPNSCSNRHCPNCQSDKGRKWLSEHIQTMLPCTYFMVTFTVPQQIRELFYANQKKLYGALFKAAWESMKTMAKDSNNLGLNVIGAIGVLHTWTKLLTYHPHVHFLVPAGGLDEHGKWVRTRQDFFLHVKPLSRLFRGKMLHELNRLGLKEMADPALWKIEWNVNCQPKGSGINALGYLSAYLFRVAISNSRILHAQHDSVTFKCKKDRSDKFKKVTISNQEFIRRFLLHVLPKGFVKVRHYGFLAPNAKVDIQKLAKEILDGFIDTWNKTIEQHTQRCRNLSCLCGGTMILIERTMPEGERMIT